MVDLGVVKDEQTARSKGEISKSTLGESEEDDSVEPIDPFYVSRYVARVGLQAILVAVNAKEEMRKAMEVARLD
ncbi:hypothetical protein AXG93_4421s1380 [Marchantia polymorpha subsp. ruderalis]|uniref:Uncharacterized protein n=1 Tax=Marchantia polymorpha subsp. ruderalis TaxID=1480154 RepID=A0A176WI56_MARPO|nr:hypothetical protein AXG93_4421s1380 [Marchantia polymorpha subsp. ruderalis]